ncbi:class I SAM-dependent methyltransferase [Azospirillum lipoferum]|nr:class I SAM-dependent methyltransferase [Azospirillum lipoferum]
MFQHDRLHPRWIDDCARYLRVVFGDRLEGACVLDYGFGRGNWALAFRKAGARRVVAIDAAEGNVRRFSDFLHRDQLSGIEVIHGDALVEPLAYNVDHVWLYGVLHHVGQPGLLLERLSAAASGPQSHLLVYAYDRGSVRETIVGLVREVVLYEEVAEFTMASGLFCPAARLRARDDLTAPIIRWYSAVELEQQVREHGWRVIARPPDFPVFLGRPGTGEFAPHHLLCAREAGRLEETSSSADISAAAAEDTAADCAALRALWDDLKAGCSAERMAHIGIGLFNAHFAALAYTGRVEEALIQDFLHLAFQCEDSGVSVRSECSRHYRVLAALSAADRPRASLAAALPGHIARHLAGQAIRF